MKSLFFLTLFVSILSCSNNQDKGFIPSEIKEKPRETISRAEVEEIKACNLKLDACILNCKKEYPSLSVRFSEWGVCKDRCINKFSAMEGCMIYYESFRSNKHRLWYGK